MLHLALTPARAFKSSLVSMAVSDGARRETVCPIDLANFAPSPVVPNCAPAFPPAAISTFLAESEVSFLRSRTLKVSPDFEIPVTGVSYMTVIFLFFIAETMMRTTSAASSEYGYIRPEPSVLVKSPSF